MSAGPIHPSPAVEEAPDRQALLAQLEVEASAHLEQLPSLQRQLGETAKQVETAVVEIGSCFEGLTRQIRQSVSESAQLLGSADDHTGLEALIETSETALSLLLQRVSSNADQAERAAARMMRVGVCVKKVNDVVEQFNDVVLGTKLLGVNAKIEAVRLAQEGQSFAEVASQISQFSKTSSQLSWSIQELVDEVLEEVSETTAALSELATEDAEFITQQRVQVETLLNELRDTHETSREFLSRTHEQGRELEKNISRAVVGLQFQDRVSQRIEHVVEALDALHSDVGRPLGALAGESGEQDNVRRDEIRRLQHDRYTMESERIADDGSGAADEDDDDDVELF